MNLGAEFFTFVTLVAVLMVVIYALGHPSGITGILGGFSNILGNLKTTN